MVTVEGVAEGRKNVVFFGAFDPTQRASVSPKLSLLIMLPTVASGFTCFAGRVKPNLLIKVATLAFFKVVESRMIFSNSLLVRTSELKLVLVFEAEANEDVTRLKTLFRA